MKSSQSLRISPLEKNLMLNNLNNNNSNCIDLKISYNIGIKKLQHLV